MSIFGDIERFVADLYPYRWPITLACLLFMAAVAVVAFRRGMHLFIWRHRLATAVVLVPLLAIGIPLGNYLLSPLWERSHLEEASPLAVAAAETNDGGRPRSSNTSSASIDNPVLSPSARITLAGEWRGADDFHFGRGKALIIETEPGKYVLRVEEFSVRNSPDLFVYLSPNSTAPSEGAFNLGRLKATDGAFNYEIPPGTDISKSRSALIWCKQFSVLFALATLNKAQ